MARRIHLVLALAALVVAASAAFFFSGVLPSRAVQDPTIRIDMVTSGNTYFESTNTMSVGSIQSCLTTPTGNNLQHLHTVHLVIENVEDLVGWLARVNYVGDQMRPHTVSYTPFFDGFTGQNISFVNLPIEQATGAHRDVIFAQNIPPSAPGPQTARFGSSYNGTPDFALSPDTPAKDVPDDNSYSAPTGGVLASINTQVLAGNAGNPSLFLNLDDGSPNFPGTRLQIFDGQGIVEVDVPAEKLGDGYHGEGATCVPLDCVNNECPSAPTPTPTPVPDSDGDGVPDGSDNCPNWPNPAQDLPPWRIPADDPDCDGFSTTVENSAGTDPLAHCGTDAWPADVNNDTFVSTHDIALMAGQFGQPVPPAPARLNIAPDPVDGFIDSADIAKMTGFYGRTCS